MTGTGIMGYITIPRIGVELPIYHGTSDAVLQVAAGHLEGTSLPVGGESTHAVISAHRGLPSAKLFTHLDRLEVGDTFTITVLDRELTYEVDKISIVLPTEVDELKVVDGKPWPTNQGGGYSGSTVTLQYGLAQSKNTISARTLDMISDAGAVDYSLDFISNRFHISTLDSVKDCDYAPMATGGVTNGVTVLEMTAAYASFGNGGYYYEPYCYTKIEDVQGNVVLQKQPEKTKESALSENTAWVMNKLLQTVMTAGTGTPYKLSGIQCFGKTGTTTDDKDRWFMGGTPDFVAAYGTAMTSPRRSTTVCPITPPVLCGRRCCPPCMTSWTAISIKPSLRSRKAS